MAESGLGKARMEAMSDGVFSVAMTLVLADLITPDGLERWAAHLAFHLGLLSVTFFIIAIYWTAHHNECRLIQETNRLIFWVNFSFLGPVACLPIFLASLMRESQKRQCVVPETFLSCADVRYLIAAIVAGAALTTFHLSFACCTEIRIAKMSGRWKKRRLNLKSRPQCHQP